MAETLNRRLKVAVEASIVRKAEKPKRKLPHELLPDPYAISGENHLKAYVREQKEKARKQAAKIEAQRQRHLDRERKAREKEEEKKERERKAEEKKKEKEEREKEQKRKKAEERKKVAAEKAEMAAERKRLAAERKELEAMRNGKPVKRKTNASKTTTTKKTKRNDGAEGVDVEGYGESQEELISSDGAEVEEAVAGPSRASSVRHPPPPRHHDTSSSSEDERVARSGRHARATQSIQAMVYTSTSEESELDINPAYDPSCCFKCDNKLDNNIQGSDEEARDDGNDEDRPKKHYQCHRCRKDFHLTCLPKSLQLQIVADPAEIVPEDIECEYC